MRAHAHALSSGVVLAFLRAAGSQRISRRAKAVKHTHTHVHTHTPFYTATRGSHFAICSVCWCRDPRASVRLLQRSFPTGPGRHLSPWQHRPRNHGPSLRIQGLAVCAARTPHIAHTPHADWRGEGYESNGARCPRAGKRGGFTSSQSVFGCRRVRAAACPCSRLLVPCPPPFLYYNAEMLISSCDGILSCVLIVYLFRCVKVAAPRFWDAHQRMCLVICGDVFSVFF